MHGAYGARARLGVLLGCMVESGLAIAAGAQVASLMDNVDLDGNLLLAEDHVAGRRVPRRRAAPRKPTGTRCRSAISYWLREGRRTAREDRARRVLGYGREPVVAILDSTHAGETYEASQSSRA